MSALTEAATARRELRVEIDGVAIAAVAATPARASDSAPLIAAIPGGGYTRGYFDTPGASLLDVAVAVGHPVVSIDRPGYGDSGPAVTAADTFVRQAQLLGAAIARLAESLGASGVVLIGHSMGGMIALEIAARPAAELELLGVATTGMGAVLRPGGAAEEMAAAAAAAAGREIVQIPTEQAEQIYFGPQGTYDARVREAARTSYAPVPVAELLAAGGWQRRLQAVAPLVRVPVQNVLAEFDALWDPSASSAARFQELFDAAPFVETAVARFTGHSIDHHHRGRALHLRQLAFAAECAAPRIV
jgi:pimeloyl-ACP methyl ester carboxylesterase